jgi:solute carrier family 25 folate transporter 32
MRREESQHLGHAQHMGAAIVAGVSALFITNPIWVMKTRMCLQGTPSSSFQCSNMFNGFYKLYKNEGVRGFYRGMLPGLFGVSHGAFQFASYEEFKRWLNE